MTGLLTADEAARLRPGELLVIVRAGDPSPDAVAVLAQWREMLDKGFFNDSVRDRQPPEPQSFVAPQDWVALTGPCPTCDGKGSFTTASTRGKWETDELPCTDCRDGRRIEPLYTECPVCGGTTRNPDDGDFKCLSLCEYNTEPGRVLVGRGSIEVVPVVDRDSPELGDRIVYLPPYINTPPTLWLVWRGQRHSTLTLDPLPAPGRDWGILIDCVEVAGPPAEQEAP